MMKRLGLLLFVGLFSLTAAAQFPDTEEVPGNLRVIGTVKVDTIFNFTGPFLTVDDTLSVTKAVGIGTSVPGQLLDVRGGAIFNEDGGDFDFRIEGDAETNLLKVDAGNDAVGIGVTAPSAKFEVEGNGATSATNTAEFHNSSGNNNALIIRDDGFVGIGTTTPAAGELFKVARVTRIVTSGAETYATVGTVLFLENSADPADNVGIHFASGNTGENYLQFGDTDAENRAEINFDHNNEVFKIITQTQTRINIDGSGRLGFGDVANFNGFDAVFNGNGVIITKGDDVTTDKLFEFAQATGNSRLRMYNTSQVVTHDITTLSGGITIFNSANDDIDFQINGDVTSNLFRINAGLDNVGIGNASPASVAMLEVTSTTKCFRLTPMTAAQASAITPIEGLQVFVSDTDATFTTIGFWGYENGAWVDL